MRKNKERLVFNQSFILDITTHQYLILLRLKILLSLIRNIA